MVLALAPERGLRPKFRLRLRELREARFLSQRALAEKANVSVPTIVRLEAGEGAPTWQTINRLAEALNIPPSELIDPAND